jgi:serine/threonine protein kinase
MPLQQGDPSRIGRYQLTARLGAGGMGVVYLGYADDRQQVAVKVLRPEYADDPEFRARFQREAAAMGRVRSRYAVRVLDADTDSATPFLVTEFAEGPSLSEYVDARGPLHPEAVYRLAAALAEALAAIHAAGVAHRDLKPSNVLLTNAGPMVIDFGIAQLADGASITRTGMAIGSPGYMAPEQVTGHAGQEADIFTWALIVAFAAGGRPPFGTGPTVGILHRILHENPDVSAVPPQLMPLIMGALAKDPGRRPRAVDLLSELSPGAAAGMAPPTVVDRQAGRTVLDNGFSGNTALLGNTARTRTVGAQRSPRRWRGPTIAAAAVVAILAVTGAVLMSHDFSQSGNGPASGGNGPVPAVTTSTLPGAGSVTQTPQTQPTTMPQEPPGQVRKHKHHQDGGDTSGSGDTSGTGDNGSGDGGVATSSPTASTAPSPSAGDTTTSSPSATASSSPGSGG